MYIICYISRYILDLERYEIAQMTLKVSTETDTIQKIILFMTPVIAWKDVGITSEI